LEESTPLRKVQGNQILQELEKEVKNWNPSLVRKYLGLAFFFFFIVFLENHLKNGVEMDFQIMGPTVSLEFQLNVFVSTFHGKSVDLHQFDTGVGMIYFFKHFDEIVKVSFFYFFFRFFFKFFFRNYFYFVFSYLFFSR
jgi:hypothetical protein